MINAWIDENGECNAPAASALAVVLRTIMGPERVVCRDQKAQDNCYRVCSYREDFDYLWGIGSRLADIPATVGRVCTFVIAWDGMPAEPEGRAVSVNKYLTPFDWAIAASLGMAERETQCVTEPRADESPGQEPGTDFRVLILDLASQSMAAADSVWFFSQSPQCHLPGLPWVHVFRPVGNLGRPGRLISEFDILPLALLADSFARDTKVAAHRLNFFSECDGRKRDADLRRLQRIWGSSLARPAEPDEHHAVANLVGPLLLKQSDTEDRHERALQVLLERLVLVSHKDEQQPVLSCENPWINWKEEPWKTAIKHAHRWEQQPLNVVLVDDNVFRYGWGEVLCTAIGVKPRGVDPTEPAGVRLLGTRDDASAPIRVYGVASGEQWLELTARAPMSQAGSKSGGDGTAATPAKTAPPEGCDHLTLWDGANEIAVDILFLDLRLHQGQSSTSEATYFERVLAMASQYCTEATGGSSPSFLPWPGFARAELHKVAEWVKGVCERRGTVDRKSERYRSALTLLPRLIALTDPSLPIVLFSSTGQREIVEILRPYGNIITAFDKPRLAGSLDSSLVVNTAAKFQAAVASALTLVAGRRLCCELLHKRDGAPKAEARLSLAIQQSPRPRVEAYFDETGRNNEFRVGGLVAIYPDEQAAITFASVMRDEGIVWGWHRDDPWEPRPARSLQKSSEASKDVVKRTLEQLETLTVNNGIELAVFSLGCAYGQSNLSWSGPDQLFRTLLRDSIEMLLFEWIPDRLGEIEFDAGIYVATRLLFRKSGTDLLSISRNFGLDLLEINKRPYTRDVKCCRDQRVIESFVQTHPEDDLAYKMCWDWKKMREKLQVFLDTQGRTDEEKADLDSQGFQDVKQLLAYSFSYDHLHPILGEVLGERHPEIKRPRIAAGQGVRLSYYDYPKDISPHQLPRQIHYVADWVIAHQDCIPPEWSRRGFRESRDRHFQHLLNACRQADCPDGAVEAVIEWSRADHAWDRPMVGWVGDRVARCIQGLSGDEFVHICRQLSLDHREQEAQDWRKTLLYVGNLAPDQKKEEILEWFRDYSPKRVNDIRRDARGKPYTFVLFDSAENAAKVLELASSRKRAGWPRGTVILPPKQ